MKIVILDKDLICSELAKDKICNGCDSCTANFIYSQATEIDIDTLVKEWCCECEVHNYKGKFSDFIKEELGK